MCEVWLELLENSVRCLGNLEGFLHIVMVRSECWPIDEMEQTISVCTLGEIRDCYG
jgi:hypothetical protein